jgi:hypothetical protein
VGQAEITVKAQDIEYTATLETLCCGSCSVVFAIPKNMHRRLKQDGEFFWCPNGDKIRYLDPENDKLQRQIRQIRETNSSLSATLTHERDQRKAAERQASARKGVITRMRGRLAKGVCAECEQEFPDLGAHMHDAHPDFEKQDV